MAIPKKAKKRSEPVSAAATLDELESLSDRIATWLTENQMLVLGIAAAVLVLGAAFGFVRSNLEDARLEASAELARVERAYRVSMGAQPHDLVIREPANPETGQRVREEFVGKFRAVAEAHAGSAGGTLAAMQAGILELELGQEAAALETWRSALAELSPSDPLTAFLAMRIAAVLEDQGDWTAAGESYEQAAAVEPFPLRYGALADAARCFAEAGDEARALAAFARIEAEAPEFFLPEHVGAQLRELKARSQLD